MFLFYRYFSFYLCFVISFSLFKSCFFLINYTKRHTASYISFISFILQVTTSWACKDDNLARAHYVFVGKHSRCGTQVSYPNSCATVRGGDEGAAVVISLTS